MIQWFKKQWLRYRVWRFKRELAKANAAMQALQAAFAQWHRDHHQEQQVTYVVLEEDEGDESRVVN